MLRYVRTPPACPPKSRAIPRATCRLCSRAACPSVGYVRPGAITLRVRGLSHVCLSGCASRALCGIVQCASGGWRVAGGGGG
eukprot:3608572-Pleurochrysis_carterae.AAC.1